MVMMGREKGAERETERERLGMMFLRGDGGVDIVQDSSHGPHGVGESFCVVFHLKTELKSHGGGI